VPDGLGREREVLRERIRLLFAHARPILLGGWIAAVILALVLRERIDGLWLSIWLLGATAINATRFGLLAVFQHRAAGPFNPLRWGWAFAVGSGVFGLFWGLGFYLFFKPEPLELILLTLVLAGMVAGSMASLSAFPPAYVLYVSGAVGLFIARLLQETDPLYEKIAGLTVLFAVVNVLYSRNAQFVLVTAIQLRLEKEALAVELNRQIAATQAAREKAERASLEKSQLLAATSHDLRQPVHAQALYLEILRQDLAGRPEADIVERICEAGNALSEMLDSLLEISRIEAGGMLPEHVDFPLYPLQVRLEREFMPQAHAQGLRFTMLPTSTWCHSDAWFVERILRNLISNALRYTQRGGVLVCCRRRGDFLLLQVWDSGIGIPLHEQRNIFREFQQLANPERDRRKGLGLGLAIVDRMSRLLGHAVRVASRPGRGSLFELKLPQARPPPLARPVAAVLEAVPDLPPGLSVLVLDDDPMVLDAARQMLTRLGCRACCVDSLAAASEAVAAAGGWQILLVDYRLPGNVDGVEAAQKLHALMGRRIPTAVITGDILPNRLEKARQAGFPVLHKPLDGARFRALLASLSHSGMPSG